MSEQNDLHLSPEDIIRFNSYSRPKDEQVYILSDPLRNAVKVALMLQQPLLITGEPGTGKTALAYKVAATLNEITKGDYRLKPFVFNTKSGSTANDLFYTYDAISHFFDANISRHEKTSTKGVEEYITLQAFGKAIVGSHPFGERKNVRASNAMKIDEQENEKARNSVVLIDEIDKASRDFPNDILNEIEKYEFSIKEADYKKYGKADNTHIFLIMTSNSEKALPEPFLRRCVFYHIDFPGATEIKKILEAHASKFSTVPTAKLIEWVIPRFERIRDVCKEKKPATAELISWVKILAEKKFNPEAIDPKILSETIPTLVKNQDDLKRVNAMSW